MASISPYLQIIRESIDGEQVRDAIINCMNEINKDAAFIVKSKVISGTLSEKGHATYRAESGEVWKDVTLNITADDGSEVPQTVTRHDWEVNNDTINQEYTAKELFGDNTEFGTITVNLDFTRGAESIADNIIITTFDLDEHSTWHAEADGRYSAVRSITFSNVDVAGSRGGTVGPGGKIYYDVSFMDDDGKMLGQPQKVIAGGSAVEPTDKPTKAGKVLIGWDPEIDNVRYSFTAKPRWKSPAIIGGATVYLEDVLRSRGADQAFGDHFDLRVENAKIPYEACAALGFDTGGATGTFDYTLTTGFFKVAEGEDSSTSTWLSYYSLADYPGRSGTSSLCPFTHSDRTSYKDSLFRKFLNSILYTYVIPSELKNTIKTVAKQHAVQRSGIVIVDYTNDKLWNPSFRELSIIADGKETDPDYSWYNYYKKPSGAIQYFENIGKNTASDRYDCITGQIGSAYRIAVRDDTGGIGAWYSPTANITVSGLTESNANASFSSSVFGFCL